MDDSIIRFANVIPSFTEPIGWTGTPIVQTGVDVVGKSLGWLPPPSVISSPSAKTLLESSPVALAGGAVGLKTVLFTEAGAAFAMAPVASTGFIGLAFLVGLAIGVGLDYGVGAVLKDGQVDTLSEWLATKWSESLSLPVSNGWRFIPDQKIDAPSGLPTDPVRSPGEPRPPMSAPPVYSGEEMEMKGMKEETIGDPPISSEVLLAAGPEQPDHLAAVSHILFTEPAESVVQKLIDYTLTHFNGGMGAIFRCLRESWETPARIIELLGELGADSRLRGDFVGLAQIVRNLEFEIAPHERHFIIEALGRIGSNPKFKGDLNALSQEVVNSGEHRLTIMSALGRIGSNPNFNGDFAGLVRYVMHWPHNWAISDQIITEQTAAVVSIVSNPSFDGDFGEVKRSIFSRLYSTLEAERTFQEMDQENFAGFLTFLQTSETFFKSINKDFEKADGPLLAARLFADYASQPNLSPNRREALADAIIGGLGHSDPKIREAFRKAAPSISKNEKTAPWVRELFFLR